MAGANFSRADLEEGSGDDLKKAIKVGKKPLVKAAFEVALDDAIVWLDRAEPDSMFKDLKGTEQAVLGDEIRLWLDKSGNSNHAVAEDDAKLPTFSEGSVSFEADRMVCKKCYPGKRVEDCTIITVLSQSASQTGNVYRTHGFGCYDLNGLEGGSQHWNMAPDPSLRFDGSALAGYHTVAMNFNTMVRTTEKVGNSFREWFGDTLAMPEQVLTTNDLVPDFYMGHLHGPTYAYFREVIVIPRGLTKVERVGVIDYLHRKWASEINPG